MTDSETLSIKYYEDRSRRLFGDDLPKGEILRDLDLHTRVVIDAVRREQAQAVISVNNMKSDQAKEYILYGVGRRLGMLAHSLTSLFAIAPPDREAPISSDEGHDLTRDLNVVYINIVGVIDNLAWSSLFERAPTAVTQLPPAQVGLFSKALGQVPALRGLSDLVTPYRSWFEELRARRDPAAHRIPLYLPPSLLNAAQVAEHERLAAKASDVVQMHDWAAWDDLLTEQRKLGRFYPVFLHSPREPLYRFYPTVAEDAGQMVRIVRDVTNFLAGGYPRSR
jgi:hypothetical protein